MSFAIFIRLVASVLSAPDAKTVASWPASAANLFGAVTNGRPVSSAMRARDALGELRVAVDARSRPPCPPSAISYRPGQRRLDPRDVAVELGDVAAELLAERQRAPRPGGASGRSSRRRRTRPRFASSASRRARTDGHEVLDEGHRDGHVERRREGVVARLAAVDVVVRVDRLLAAARPRGEPRWRDPRSPR